MGNDEADEVIKELFGSLKNRYRNNLESMIQLFCLRLCSFIVL